ncbi:hypothetical protein J31TS6_62440 [Brevibacillus reuszeri]|uniref:hypothetical protein n=1 Tax=Brevibacillus reuszeri TaxID=54915 RepID=UPI001B1A50F5|nr:hypothetical protein [Brevibacillus reuszeri]GIO10216.1 hypothetical protein J31TS6_62440 [Brevibacillus reuszeri]
MQAGRELDKRSAAADLAMCEAATPGPWELEPEADEDEGLVIWRKIAEHPGRSEGVIVLNPECHYEDADITFITEAREALPYWIQRAQAAEEALRWYADQNNYSIPHLGCAPKVMADRGKRAHDILKELGFI